MSIGFLISLSTYFLTETLVVLSEVANRLNALASIPAGVRRRAEKSA
jgi:hypothetical protein